MGIPASQVRAFLERGQRAQAEVDRILGAAIDRKITTTRQPGDTRGRGMNDLERRFRDDVLEPQRLARDVLWYAFEAINLQIGHRTWYRPDFAVVHLVHSDEAWLRFYELKGYWRDDARVKIKVAAATFPHFDFTAVTRRDGSWHYEPILRPANVNGGRHG